VGALSKDERTGAIRVDTDPASPSACIGCAACVDACPFGMAALHPETGVAILCDLCGGDPACVKRCATGAIVYAQRGAGPQARREALTRITSRQETGFSGKNLVSGRTSSQSRASTTGEEAADV
jgi:Fe-S-cluster-containing dehydrogenase component